MAFNITIKHLRNTDPIFYNLLGPFLARRSITKELGGMVWDDDNAVWFVALQKQSVFGFCALRLTHSGAQFCHDYVLPQYRKHGVYELLFKTRLSELYKLCEDKTVKVRSVVRETARPIYEKFGFKQIRGTKNFSIMELVVKC